MRLPSVIEPHHQFIPYAAWTFYVSTRDITTNVILEERYLSHHLARVPQGYILHPIFIRFDRNPPCPANDRHHASVVVFSAIIITASTDSRPASNGGIEFIVTAILTSGYPIVLHTGTEER